MKPSAPLLALALAALAPLPAPAQQAGLAVQAQGRQGAYDVFLVRDEAGLEITVLAEGPVTDAQRETLLALRERALGLRSLRVRNARALVTPDAIDLLVVPDAYVYEGQNLMPFLPGGIRFHLDGVLSYDFRMLVGHYFLRITGPFESEDALSRRLLEAASTPAAFLKADTTEYLSDRFAALEGRLEDAEGRGMAALQSLGAKMSDLERQGSDALRDIQTQGGAALKDLESTRGQLEGLRSDAEAARAETSALKDEQKALRTEQNAARGELDAVKSSLASMPTARLEADVQALQQSLGALGAEAEALRTAVVVLHSRGGNFGRRGVDRDAITRLVELKRANPALSQADASAALKAGGVSMSSKDIALVFGVFFRDYR